MEKKFSLRGKIRKLKYPLSKLEVDQVFVLFIFLQFDSGICVLFNKENELNLIKIGKNQNAQNQP